jgi:hypothetical protein
MLANSNRCSARWRHVITRLTASALVVLICGVLGVAAAYACNMGDQLSPTALWLDTGGFVNCPYPFHSSLSSTATVSLGAPATANDRVTLTANPLLSLSTTAVVIPTGASSATFTVTASNRSTWSGSVSVTASLNGSTSTVQTTYDYCHN